jgi:acyl-[acyl-carrier-protein] desaturase
MAKEWMPHEYVPWRLGRDFDTEPWTPDQPRLTGMAQAAFEVNLLTEGNLPSYHRELLASFGRDGAWNTWSHRWTAEEGRHAVVLRDYLLVTRNIDPVALEQGRMATVQQGWMPEQKPALGLMAYAAFQELATRISTATPAATPMTRWPTGSCSAWQPTRTCT